MTRRIPAHWLLMAPGLVLFLFFFLIPIGQLVVISFYSTVNGVTMQPDFVFDQYAKFFTDPYYLKILGQTLWIALIVSFISLILGYTLAYGVARANPKHRYLLLLIIALPLLTSAVIRNFGWMVILSRKGILNTLLLQLGWIDQHLELLYTVTGVVIALVHVLLPFMVLVLYPVLVGMDRNVELAASSLGASPARVFWYVTLPISLPGIIAGTLLVFSICVSFYITPALIGGAKVQVMATEIYDLIMSQSNWPYASALSVIVLVVVIVITNLYNRAISKSTSQGAGQL